MEPLRLVAPAALDLHLDGEGAGMERLRLHVLPLQAAQETR